MINIIVFIQSIYPTAVIVLTAFTKSYLERTIHLDSMPSLRVAGPPASNSRRRSPVDILRDIEETIELQSHHHTVDTVHLGDAESEHYPKDSV